MPPIMRKSRAKRKPEPRNFPGQYWAMPVQNDELAFQPKEPVMIIRTLTSFVLLAVICHPASAQEWTRFRGPNGSGQSEATTIPAAWTEGEYLWKASLAGVGNGSPVVWGERVFLLSADPKDGTRHVICLSASDGKQLWKQDFAAGTHRIHQQNTLASSTPAVDRDYVYCAWATPEELTLVALSHDGTTAWRRSWGPFRACTGSPPRQSCMATW